MPHAAVDSSAEPVAYNAPGPRPDDRAGARAGPGRSGDAGHPTSMMVLDSFAVLAYLKGEPAAGRVERLIRRDPTAALTALGVAEVLDHLVRLVGVDEEEAVLDLAQLGLAEPFTVDPGITTRAGRTRARRYHRRECAVSLADVVALETARERNAPVATADAQLLATCRAEHVQVLPLPNSVGTSSS